MEAAEAALEGPGPAPAAPWWRHHPPVGQAARRRPGRRQVHPSHPQHSGGLALVLGEHPEQDMLGTEVAVTKPLCLLPGKVRDPMGGRTEAADHFATARTGTIHPPALLHRARSGHARPKLGQQRRMQLLEVDPEGGKQ